MSYVLTDVGLLVPGGILTQHRPEINLLGTIVLPYVGLTYQDLPVPGVTPVYTWLQNFIL